MQLERVGWKAHWTEFGSRAGRWAWAVLLALFAAALVHQTVRSRGETGDLVRLNAALDRQIAQMREGNRALRDELKALETDPVYIESLLRNWKRVGAGELEVE